MYVFVLLALFGCSTPDNASCEAQRTVAIFEPHHGCVAHQSCGETCVEAAKAFEDLMDQKFMASVARQAVMQNLMPIRATAPPRITCERQTAI